MDTTLSSLVGSSAPSSNDNNIKKRKRDAASETPQQHEFVEIDGPIEILKPAPSFTYFEEDNIADELKCPICLEVLCDPVVHSECGNVFCEKCVLMCAAYSTDCSFCRCEIKELRLGVKLPKANRPLLNLLDKLTVTCSDCNAQVKKSEFETHVPHCPQPCPLGCGATISRATVAEHDAFCPNKRILCPMSPDCRTVIRRGSLLQHYKEAHSWANKAQRSKNHKKKKARHHLRHQHPIIDGVVDDDKHSKDKPIALPTKKPLADKSKNKKRQQQQQKKQQVIKQFPRSSFHIRFRHAPALYNNNNNKR